MLTRIMLLEQWLININFSLNTESSFGGSNFEDIASIKFRAPRYFAKPRKSNNQ